MIKRYLIVFAIIGGVVTTSFLAIEALGIPLLTDPTDLFADGGLAAAALGVGLLLADVFIPVPSSIVMTAQGAIFGFGWGTLLGLIGSVGATIVGFAIGRRGAAMIRRFVGSGDQAWSASLLGRWGTLAIILTRPLPILAETTAIVAGSTAMTWRQAVAGALVGCLPAAAIYSAAGAFASDIATGMLVFPLVVLLGGAFWVVAWLMERAALKQRGPAIEQDAPSVPGM